MSDDVRFYGLALSLGPARAQGCLANPAVAGVSCNGMLSSDGGGPQRAADPTRTRSPASMSGVGGQGRTAYGHARTLRPYRKTPACADALWQQRSARVVICLHQTSDPRVSGKGQSRHPCHAAGIGG